METPSKWRIRIEKRLKAQKIQLLFTPEKQELQPPNPIPSVPNQRLRWEKQTVKKSAQLDKKQSKNHNLKLMAVTENFGRKFTHFFFIFDYQKLFCGSKNIT